MFLRHYLENVLIQINLNFRRDSNLLFTMLPALSLENKSSLREVEPKTLQLAKDLWKDDLVQVRMKLEISIINFFKKKSRTRQRTIGIT